VRLPGDRFQSLQSLVDRVRAAGPPVQDLYFLRARLSLRRTGLLRTGGLARRATARAGLRGDRARRHPSGRGDAARRLLGGRGDRLPAPRSGASPCTSRYPRPGTGQPPGLPRARGLSILDAAVPRLGSCHYAPRGERQRGDRGRRLLPGASTASSARSSRALDVVDQIRKMRAKSRGPHQGVPVTSILIESTTATN
jgi:hypothetical protein